MSISVVGAGAFGTALAVALAQKQEVTLWARDAEHAAQMQRARQNARRLSGVAFPRNLSVSCRPDTVFDADTILIALPM